MHDKVMPVYLPDSQEGGRPIGYGTVVDGNLIVEFEDFDIAQDMSGLLEQPFVEAITFHPFERGVDIGVRVDSRRAPKDKPEHELSRTGIGWICTCGFEAHGIASFHAASDVLRHIEDHAVSLRQ